MRVGCTGPMIAMASDRSTNTSELALVLPMQVDLRSTLFCETWFYCLPLRFFADVIHSNLHHVWPCSPWLQLVLPSMDSHHLMRQQVVILSPTLPSHSRASKLTLAGASNKRRSCPTHHQISLSTSDWEKETGALALSRPKGNPNHRSYNLIALYFILCRSAKT